MAKRIFSKVCSYCNLPFEAKSQFAKTCSDGCRVMAYKVRNNIPIPDFRVKEMFNRIPKKNELEIVSRTKRLEAINQAINKLKNTLTTSMNAEIKVIDKEIDSFNGQIKAGYFSLIYSQYPSQVYKEWSKRINELWAELFNISDMKGYNNIKYSDKPQHHTAIQNAFIEEKRVLILEIRSKYETLLKEQLKDLIDESEHIDGELRQLYKGYNVDSLVSQGKIISTDDIMNIDFDLYQFDLNYDKVFGNPDKSFVCMLHGSQGSGKSMFTIGFASYFNKFQGSVIYFPIEEGLSYTFKLKVQNNAKHGAFQISTDNTPKSIQKQSENYNLCIIDSISHLNFTDEDLKVITTQKNITKTSFIFLVHEKKDGDYKGGSELGHLVDIIFKADNGILTVEKNRYLMTDKKEASYTIYE